MSLLISSVMNGIS